MTTIEKQAPALSTGMRLTRAEFLRRWDLHPEGGVNRRTRLLAKLQKGLEVPEHHAFVERLSQLCKAK